MLHDIELWKDRTEEEVRIELMRSGYGTAQIQKVITDFQITKQKMQKASFDAKLKELEDKEAEVTKRETEVAKREAEVAKKEATLVKKETELSKKETEVVKKTASTVTEKKVT